MYNFNHRYILTLGDRISQKIQNNNIIYILYIYYHIFARNKYLIHIILGGETFVGKHMGQTFVVVFQQVCTDLGRDFGPLLFADLLQIL